MCAQPLDSQATIDDYHLITQGHGVYLQHHSPKAMNEPYHVHPSIEVNFLEDCEMDYSFGGRPVEVPQRRFCIFWAARPHRVLRVEGEGRITNAYISLEEFWSWPLPDDFVDAILGGAVITASETLPGDVELAARLAREKSDTSDRMSRLHCLELQARITRMALTDWSIVTRQGSGAKGERIGGTSIVHFEKMLRFIARHYVERITLGDVAGAASVSENYANTLFKKVIGTTVKAHITNVRVYRARMLLVETDNKIITIAHDSGFTSLSSFYEAFQRHIGTSPADFRARLSR